MAQKTIQIRMTREKGSDGFIFTYRKNRNYICEYGLKEVFSVTKKDLELVFHVRNHPPRDDDQYHVLEKLFEGSWYITNLRRSYGEDSSYIPGAISARLSAEFPGVKKLYAWSYV